MNIIYNIISLDVFLPVIIIIGVLSLFSIILSKLKVNTGSLFVIQILIGLIMGVLFKDIFNDSLLRVNEVLYVLGLSLLIFLSGYDTDFSVVLEKQDIPILKTSFIMIGLMYLFSFGVSFLFMSYFNNKTLGLILLTLSFATTFAGVVIPLVHHKSLEEANNGKVISTFATLAELTSIISLSLVMMITLDFSLLPLLGVLLILVLAFIFKKTNITQKLMPLFGDYLELKLIVFALLIVTFLSDLAGAEYILGPFLLGMILKYFKMSKKTEHTIFGVSFGVFIPIFFVLLGMNIDMSYFLNNKETWLLTIILFMLIIFVKLPFLYLLRWFKLKDIIPIILVSSITIIVSLSTVDLSEELNVFNESLSNALIMASLLSCLILPIVFEFIIRNTDNNQICDE